MGSKSARRKNLPLSGCPNRSAFPGLKLQYHPSHTVREPWCQNTDSTSVEHREDWAHKGRYLCILEKQDLFELEVTWVRWRMWFTAIQWAALGLAPGHGWYSPNTELLQGLSLRSSKVWRCKAIWERRGEKRNRETEQDLNNNTQTSGKFGFAAQTQVWKQVLLWIAVFHRCAQILFPSSEEPTALHTLPQAYKIHSKHCSKNATEKEGGS